MSKLASAWFLLCGAISSPLSAQVADAASPDANLIRLTSLTTGTGKVTGAPVSIGADTIRLVLQGATDTIAIATSALRRIDELQGRRSNFDRGALIGALTLGLAGAIMAPVYNEAMSEGRSSNQMAAVGVGFVAGAASGALIGAAIGALSSRDRWSRHPSFAARVAPTERGLGLGLAMRLGF